MRKRMFFASVYSSEDEEYFCKDVYVYAPSLKNAVDQVRKVYPNISNVGEIDCFPHDFNEINKCFSLFEFQYLWNEVKHTVKVLASTIDDAFSIAFLSLGADTDFVEVDCLLEEVYPL